MKKHLSHIFALLVTVLLLGLGVCMPGLASAFSDKWLLTKPEEVENSGIYLTLSQNQDFMQRLKLFNDGLQNDFDVVSAGISTEMGEQEVQAAAIEAMEAIGFRMRECGLPEVTPYLFLETSEDRTSQSCVFWQCLWDSGHSDQILWIDDVSGTMITFIIELDYMLEENLVIDGVRLDVPVSKTSVYGGTEIYVEKGAIDLALVIDLLRLYCQGNYPVNSVELYSAEKTEYGYTLMLTGETEDRQVYSFMSVESQSGYLSFYPE